MKNFSNELKFKVFTCSQQAIYANVNLKAKILKFPHKSILNVFTHHLSGYEKDKAQKIIEIKALKIFRQRIEFQCFTGSEQAIYPQVNLKAQVPRFPPQSIFNFSLMIFPVIKETKQIKFLKSKRWKNFSNELKFSVLLIVNKLFSQR